MQGADLGERRARGHGDRSRRRDERRGGPRSRRRRLHHQTLFPPGAGEPRSRDPEAPPHRRQGLLQAGTPGVPGLMIDLERRQVVAQGTPVDLTAAQFDILLLLASHPERVYGRGEIMETMWSTEFSGDSRAADVQISNSREKVEPEPKNPRYMLTGRGVGYRFAEI